MASPEVSQNPTEFQKVARAAADLEQTVTAYRQYSQLQQELKEAKEMAAESAGAVLPFFEIVLGVSAFAASFKCCCWYILQVT